MLRALSPQLRHRATRRRIDGWESERGISVGLALVHSFARRRGNGFATSVGILAHDLQPVAIELYATGEGWSTPLEFAQRASRRPSFEHHSCSSHDIQAGAASARSWTRWHA